MAETKKGKRALTNSEIVSAIRPILQKAIDNDDASGKREQALKLYNREPFPGDEDIAKGRSRYQTSDVFDQVEMHTAQCLALFEGQEDVVTFEPTGPEDVELAQQQTDIVNWVLRNDNELTVLLATWLKDGFIHDLGVAVAEFYKDTKFKPSVMLKGVPDSLLADMEASPLHEVQEVGEPYEVPLVDDPEAMPEGLPMGPTMPVRDVKVAEGREKAGVRLMVIPPEDVILSADAKFSFQTGGIDAALQGYKTTTTRCELIEVQGHDAALVESIPEAKSDFDDESVSRNRYNDGGEDGTSDVEPEVYVYELFVHLNTKGSARTPLMHLTLAGEPGGSMVLLAQEEVEMAPLAAFVPSIIPNTIRGQGIASMIGKDQKFKSLMYRGMQDNMQQQLYPRAIVDQSSGVNMDDLLNDEPGAVIRTEGGADPVRWSQVPFIGQQVMMGVERLNQDIETRTGTGVNTLALNPEDLKKTTATGVSQRTSASMLRVEMTQRIFAATGYRYLFRVIGSLLASHPEESQMIMQRLRNRVVPMSADQWDTSMDVRANVSFGNTDKPQKTQTLMNILGMQKEAMGAGMPYVNPTHLYNTVAEIIALNGFKNTAKFMDDPSKMPPQEPQADKPDPELQKAQAELAFKMQVRQMELAQEKELAILRMQMERDVKMHEVSLKYEVAQKEMGTEIYLEGARMQSGATTKTNIANPTR